jgi:hypothetical protein
MFLTIESDAIKTPKFQAFQLFLSKALSVQVDTITKMKFLFTFLILCLVSQEAFGAVARSLPKKVTSK